MAMNAGRAGAACLGAYKLPKSLRAAHPEMPPACFRFSAIGTNWLRRPICPNRSSGPWPIPSHDPDLLARSAQSHWVNEEVRRFRETHGDDRIFCLLVGGSPKVGAADCAFPPALLRSDEGKTSREPLAADVSPGGDGKRNAMLKIAAGLLGVAR
jgi:hypothetical protein